MAHLLIAHPDPAVRLAYRAAIGGRAHVTDEAPDAAEAADLTRHQVGISDPFDMLVLDASFAAAVIADLGPAHCDHAVVWLGASPDPAALGHVAADAPMADLVAVTELALARRQRHLGRLAAWDEALTYVGRLTGQAEVAAVLTAGRGRLAAAIAAAAPTEAAITAAMTTVGAEANGALNALPAPLDGALQPLGRYHTTPAFQAVLQAAWATDRVRAYALLAVLLHLVTDKLAHGTVVAGCHFFFPVAGDHRVYFRWEDGSRVLEAFAPNANHEAVAVRLAGPTEAPLPL